MPQSESNKTKPATNVNKIDVSMRKRQLIVNNLPNSEASSFVWNLRFLLWNKGIESTDWPDQLQSLLEIDAANAWALLLGSRPPSDAALKKLASRFRVDPEDLLYTDLIASAKINVARENLRALTRGLAGGRKKLLAANLHVHPATISRWLGGTQLPDRKTLQQLAGYFGLKAGTDLAAEPLFLNPHPISDSDRREWLLRRIKEIDPASLSELFPALVRMLKGTRQ